MSLAGQVAVIFGGSSGMGKGAAKFVLQSGGVPFIVGRSKERLEEAAKEISPSDPSKVRTQTCDMLSEESVKNFFESIEKGSIHHIVCTAGPGANAGAIHGSEGFNGLKKQFELKFFAQMCPVSYGAEKLADGGSIVLTSGALSRRPGKGSAILACANASLEAIVKGLANDLGPRLRVNCVSPGLTNTEMWANMPAERREGMLKGFGSTLPLGRAGESDDVGRAIAYLLTATYTTGHTLDCDGGATIRP